MQAKSPRLRETKPADPLLFEGVSLSYGEKSIVEDVSFTLHPGEILGIVGESGSGKTSLIHASLGLLGPGGRVSSGRILLGNRCLSEMSEGELRQIRGAEMGLVFQDVGQSFCPLRRVGAQIYESLAAHRPIQRKEARELSLGLFHRLGFAEAERIWESYPFELSGGMNQRVGVALALLAQPQILLADEVTSALDVSSQLQVLDELLLLRHLFGTAILLVTHDLGVVRYMADSLLVLKQGKVIEYGPAQQILEAPQAHYTRELLAAVPRLQRR